MNLVIKTLIVDDDVEMLEGLTHIIPWEDYGFTITGAARNGYEALNMVTKLMPDVIITDISMPVMSGLEFIREVKKFNPYIMTVIISCHEEFEYAKEAIHLEADEYLIKHTLTEEMLIQTITSLREKRRGLSKHHRLELVYSSRISELYKEYSSTLVQAVKIKDTEKIMEASKQILEENFENVPLEMLKSMLIRLLVDMAMNVNSFDIGVEILQIDGDTADDCKTAFANTVKYLSKKLSSPSVYTTHTEIIKALDFMSAHLGENISCEGMAAYVSMNSSYFSRLFKRELGLNFSDYLLNKRLQRATELLINTNNSIEEIINAVGIESVSYFYRVYKRMTGNTPGDVRNKMRQYEK